MDKFSKHIRNIISRKIWGFTVTLLIILNTIVLGMQTYPHLMSVYGDFLTSIDQAILYLFILELSLRLIAYRLDFFKEPWSIFDFCVVAIALIPAQDGYSALRAARALRALRLISVFPKLRKVIEGLVMAIPGICAIAGVMAIIICVFGLIASKLYGASYPEWFGNLHLSVFSLFQIMTLEGWPDIVRTVMQEKPFAWIFFVTYILIATFSVLNLFIAVVVDAMQRNHTDETDDGQDEKEEKIQIINKKLDLIIEKIDIPRTDEYSRRRQAAD
ncbi:MAG: ion transporter [Gammaproteobacteria bacterium]